MGIWFCWLDIVFLISLLSIMVRLFCVMIVLLMVCCCIVFIGWLVIVFRVLGIGIKVLFESWLEFFLIICSVIEWFVLMFGVISNDCLMFWSFVIGVFVMVLLVVIFVMICGVVNLMVKGIVLFMKILLILLFVVMIRGVDNMVIWFFDLRNCICNWKFLLMYWNVKVFVFNFVLFSVRFLVCWVVLVIVLFKGGSIFLLLNFFVIDLLLENW